MRIEFQLPELDQETVRLLPEFMNTLVEDMRYVVKYQSNIALLDTRSKYLLKAEWISWVRKPRKLNMRKLIEYIADSIIFKQTDDGLFIVEINRAKRLPYSHTRLSKVARFLDKGNEVYKPTLFLSSVFNKYKRTINQYWRAFVSVKLGRIDVREVIRVR